MKQTRENNRFLNLLVFAVLVLAGIAFLAPFAWMVSTSLKPLGETMTLPPRMKDMLLEMGTLIVGSGKIFCGLAILEDGYDRTAELHAIAPGEILSREPGLLERHRHYFPALPCDDLRAFVEGIASTGGKN